MPTVAVIGGGPQGLAALKNLKEEGFDVTLFEKRNSIGGVWQFTKDEDHTSVLQSTLGNVSKYRNCFTDFPISEDAPVHLNREETLNYIRAYAVHFELHQHIQLGTQLREIRRSTDGKWHLSLLQGQEPLGRDFDKVLFCTGNTHTACIPDIIGRELFDGRILHSQAFKEPEAFNGKRVLVVGFANSAADTCSELVGKADKVYLSHRGGGHIFPRWAKGKPLDIFANHRGKSIRTGIAAIAPRTAQRMFDGLAEGLEHSTLNHIPGWALKPAPSLLVTRAMINDALPGHLREGRVKSVAGLRRFQDATHVELEDGSSIEVDTVVLCTGYRADFSTMPTEPNLQDSIEHDPSGIRLYQNMFPPQHAGSIGFLNNWIVADGINAIGDLATMAVAQIWKGGFVLPSEDAMNDWIDTNQAWIKSVVEKHGAPPALTPDSWIYWLNEAAGTGVNENLGYGLKGWEYWLWNRSFCGMLMDGALDTPHVMRLFEGRRKKWEGAKEAIICANRDAEKAMKRHKEK